MKTFNCPYEGCRVHNINGVHRLFTHWYGSHYRHESSEKRKGIRDELVQKAEAIDTNVFAAILERLQEHENGIRDEESNDIDIAADQKPSIDEDQDGYVINQFLDPKKPLCREERHYAHLLASRLRYPVGDNALKKALGIDGTVLEVMYEATLMRDFWAARDTHGRDEFTKALRQYVKVFLDRSKKLETYSERYDWDKVSVPGRFPVADDSHPLVRWMMRAKPDIGILWLPTNRPEEPTLTFLECKYRSPLSNYQENSYSMRQDCVQECILEFLCDRLALKYFDPTGDRTVPVVQGNVVPVQFVDGTDGRSTKSECGVKGVTVCISDLLQPELRSSGPQPG